MITIYKFNLNLWCRLPALKVTPLAEWEPLQDFFRVFNFNLVKFYLKFFLDLIITLHTTENHMIIFLTEIPHCNLHAVCCGYSTYYVTYSCKNACFTGFIFSAKPLALTNDIKQKNKDVNINNYYRP